MCRRVSSSRWPPEPSQRSSNQHSPPFVPLGPAKQHVTLPPPLQFLLPYQLDTKHSTVMYVCWGYFSHFTLVQNVLTVCTSLFSMCL